MIINQLKIPVKQAGCNDRSMLISDKEMKLIRKKICSKYKIKEDNIKDIRITKKSLDARKGREICYTYNICLQLKNKQEREEKNIFEPLFINNRNKKKCKTVVVGAGPAGLFCAYILALNGLETVLIEQGSCIEKRVMQVEEFWNDAGKLNEYSNVSFGEGGAGTFSDGKLNTSVKDKSGMINYVKQVFVENGAPEEIAYIDKPHIGTDELRGVISRLREKIEKMGALVRFETCMNDITIRNGCIASVKCKDINTNEEFEIECDNLVLAIGHSARKTYEMLKDKLVMERKPFAVGFRVSHPQILIDKNQYGDAYSILPAADYKLRFHAENERAVFSFCMCPGGYVVNAATEKGGTVVNGMSNHGRDSENANSAIVVNVRPEDFPGDDVLAGVEFQREFESKAYNMAKGKIPLQLLGDFKNDRESREIKDIKPVLKGEYELCNMRHIYPEYINEAFISAMSHFDSVIEGFGSDAALLCGVETRTSAPLRIARDEYYTANIGGVYPCGEGAGYAGGIMSAAVDGIKVARAVIDNLSM